MPKKWSELTPKEKRDALTGAAILIIFFVAIAVVIVAISGGGEKEPSILTVDELNRSSGYYHLKEVTVKGSLELSGLPTGLTPYPELYGTVSFIQLRGYDFPSYWDDDDIKVTGTFHVLSGYEYLNLYNYLDVKSAELLS